MSKLAVSIVVALLSSSLAACKQKHEDISSLSTPSAPSKADASEGEGNAGSAASKTVSAAEDEFDISKVPVTSAALPPFPYLKYPDGVHEGVQRTEQAEFDEAYVIAGKKLRKVEGRIESHKFDLRFANLSEVAARRNYQNLVKAMGGVKVNELGLNELAPDPGAKFQDLYEKLRFAEVDMSYDCYLVRTPAQLIWIALMFTKDTAQTLVIAEQPLKQTVGFVTADAMQSALASAGHVALYINFDTDKATIRPDGKPVVDEIVKLMNQDPSLKLTIEGHTDNSGDAKHNKTLSQQRADAVMGNLMAAGIAKDRLNAVGMGDTKPLVDNKDEAGRAKNRRVELVKQN